MGTIAAMWGSGMLCMALPYKEGFGAKQMAWVLHSAVVGAVVAPLTMLGGPILVRAACYTAGAVGGESSSALPGPLTGPQGFTIGQNSLVYTWVMMLHFNLVIACTTTKEK